MKLTAFFPLALAGTLLATAAHAQLGVKGGVNFAEVKGQGGQSTSYNTYFHVGVLYDWHVADHFAIQPELLYSLQGGNIKDAFSNYDTKLHYVTLPVLARVTFGPVFVEAGPQVGLLVSASKEGQVQVNGASTATNGSVSATSDYKKADFAVCAGAGLRFGKSLAIGGRFVGGLADINDAPTLTGLNDPRLQNRVFQLYASLEFGE